MDNVEDKTYLEPPKRADIKEYILFCADYQFILEVKG